MSFLRNIAVSLTTFAFIGSVGFSAQAAGEPGRLFSPLTEEVEGGDFGQPIDFKGKIYIEGRFRSLARLLVKTGAINMQNADVQDEFSIVEFCDIYLKYYENDFKWKEIRPLLSKKIKQEQTKWPTGLYVDGEVKLDRYDFSHKGFRLNEKAQIDNLGKFKLLDGGVRHCYIGYQPKFFPSRYTLQLEDAVTVPYVKVGETEGRALVEEMLARGNIARVIPVRFLINTEHAQLSDVLTNRVVTGEFFGELEAILFYTDETRQKVLYSYDPKAQKAEQLSDDMDQ